MADLSPPMGTGYYLLDELLGGNGLLLENHVARHLTDMEAVSTYQGTDTIQSLIVGRDVTGISAFS
jgi:glutaryl-CoA dehydrogenase